MARFPSLTPLRKFSAFKKRTTNEASISDYALNVFPVSQRVWFLGESRVNFLHFDMSPFLSC